MLTIEIELLTGLYAATAHNDRRSAEWPPHPARFFSALVAAYHDGETEDPAEREALLWLERQPAPALDVDLSPLAARRQRNVHDLFVPVNDITLFGDVERPLREARERLAYLSGNGKTPDAKRELKKAGKTVAKEEEKLNEFFARLNTVDANPSNASLELATALLPDRRTRQMRTFPVVVPERSTFALIWQESPPPSVRSALEQLTSRVTRLGHSSSLVRCTLVDDLRQPTLVPDDHGAEVLRTIGPGQLERLEKEYARHQAVESRTLPARPQRYGTPRPQPTQHRRGVFSDEWIVFERVDGARLLASRTTDITRAIRAALIEQHGSETLPGWLSGHAGDGRPVDHPHVAFITLPFVGHKHADGSVKACAIVLPSNLPEEHRAHLLKLIAQWEDTRAQSGVIELGGSTFDPIMVRRVTIAGNRSARPATWCRPATRFITATPIALDRNPGNLRSNRDGQARRAARNAQESIMKACEYIGLPRPVSVEISAAPILAGVQPVRAYLPWPGQPGRMPRVRVHADIRFSEPVHGPVILGAGRYFGLGLCLPVDAEV